MRNLTGRQRVWMWVVAVLLVALGCGRKPISRGEHDADGDRRGAGGAAGADLGDGGHCCPIASGGSSGCANLGGYTVGECHATCDFWCATNWRTERDEHGCEVTRFDFRQPQPGEDQRCLPGGVAGGQGGT